MKDLMKVDHFDPILDRMVDAGFSKSDVMRELSFAVQIFNRSKDLLKTNVQTRLEAVLNIANIGLTLNPAANECYLISRWSSYMNRLECVLMPSYRGLAKLVISSSDVIDINSQVVREKDEFLPNLGSTTEPIIHRPEIMTDPGLIVAGYAVSTDIHGIKHAEIMRIDELNEIRGKSDAYLAFKAGKIKSTPWETNTSEMYRKTLVRRITKYLPRDKQSPQLNEAIRLDNLDYAAAPWVIQAIEEKLPLAGFNNKLEDNIYRRLETNMSSREAFEILDEINQSIDRSNPVRINGGTASQKELDECIKDSVQFPNR